MITYKCPKCAFCFNQSDKTWDEAIISGSCSKCSSVLVNFAVPIKTQESEKHKLLTRSLSHKATDKAILGGALLAAMGTFFLIYTFFLFFQDQAFIPLKNASPFTKTEHPILFVFFAVTNPAIGLAFIWGGVRAILRSISKKEQA